MSYLSLNDTAKGYVIAACMFSVIILLIAVIVSVSEKKSLRVALLCVFFIISMIDLAVIMELNKYQRAIYSFDLQPISVFVNEIPYFLHVAWNMTTTIFAICSMYVLYKSNKSKISVFSVKEAIENLPTGIVFMSDSVELLLSNHLMHRLSKELTKKPLQSGRAFWEDLMVLQNEDNCVITGIEPAYKIGCDEVWQFSKTLFDYNGDEYYQIKATNITELYNLSANTRKVNEKLTLQQDRLEKLANIIEENTKEQVAVNMKVNFHDNFGNLLTLTKKTLRETENIDEAKTLVEYWGNLNDVITELSSDEKQNLSLEQVLLLAEKLGCEIILTGDMPQDEHDNTTVLLCINEMLKNAYRHADAQKLRVEILQATSGVRLNIHNETKSKLTSIKEGGGLSGLRQRIEQRGGEMSMDCTDGVTMSVVLY